MKMMHCHRPLHFYETFYVNKADLSFSKKTMNFPLLIIQINNIFLGKFSGSLLILM